jgi:hypothetical protein
MDELNWIRRFYRARLARFAVARVAKRVYLVLRLGFLQSRHWIAWHSHQALHAVRVHSAQTLHAASYRTRRFAHAQLDTAAYRTRMGLHAAAYNTRQGLHAASYNSRRIANQKTEAIAYRAKMSLHAAAYTTRQGLHAATYNTMRVANQTGEAAAYRAKMGLHAAAYTTRQGLQAATHNTMRVANQTGEAAAYRAKMGLHAAAYTTRQGLHAASYNTMRVANQTGEAAAYRAKMGLHAAAYNTRQGLHAASYNTMRVANHTSEAAAYHAKMGLHAAAYTTRQGLHAASYNTIRVANQKTEAAAYHARASLQTASYVAKQGVHAASHAAHQGMHAASYAAHQGVHAASYAAQQGMHAASYAAHQGVHAASYAAQQGVHAASYAAHQGVHSASVAVKQGLHAGASAGQRLIAQQHLPVASYGVQPALQGAGAAAPALPGGLPVDSLFGRARNFALRLAWGTLGYGLERVARLCEILAGQKVTFYRLRSFAEYQEETQAPAHELVSEQVFEIETPDVHPAEYDGCLHTGVWQLGIPAIQAFEVPNALVLGKSDLLFLKDECLHHGLYHFGRDQLFEEIHGHVSIKPRDRMLARFIGEPVEDPIPAGISLVGSATSNYVHWLTETAPKLALFDELDAYPDIPYILDDGLHPNILESVRLLNSRGREIVTVERGKLLTVQRLVAISPVAYVPFDFKQGLKLEKGDIDPGFALYSPEGLNLVRSKLVNQLGELDAPRRRLYLRRGAKSRQMVNSAEVEALMQELGFDIVEPETLNFAEQVRVFSQAEMIVGQGGAAFGNIMFAPPGCHVVVLSTWSPYTIYYYFSNIASVLGQRCSFILCEPVLDEGGHRAHMGLNVPVATLKETIQS